MASGRRSAGNRERTSRQARSVPGQCVAVKPPALLAASMRRLSVPCPDRRCDDDNEENMQTRQERARVRRVIPCSLVIAAIVLSGWPAVAQDISELDQHFNEPGKDISPWMFVPKENIKEFSTEEHP